MKLHTIALGTLGFLLSVASCQQATTGSTSVFGSTKALTVTSSSTVTYWDLDSGTQVSDPTSTQWDLAFTSATQGVFTNSGDTATSAGSAGQGAVYYSGSTTFADVTSYTSSGFDRDWSTDRTVFVSTTTQNGTSTSQIVLNKMTFLDYSGGSGTQADPYTNDSSAGVYDGEAYYSYSQAISVSNEVYLVRSGDGARVFKVQIAGISGNSASRSRDLKYAAAP